MNDPPLGFLRNVEAGVGDNTISRNRIKDSLLRLAAEFGDVTALPARCVEARSRDVASKLGRGGEAIGKTRPKRRGKPSNTVYSEEHHFAQKPQEVLALYRAIDRVCLSMRPGAIKKRCLAKCINYEVGGRSFCSVHLRQSGLRVWLRLKYNRLDSPPPFAKDVSKVGHWGNGELELGVNDLSQLPQAERLIRMSFETRA